MSFFSKELYRDVAWTWRGIGLLYLFLLVTFLSTALAIEFHFGIKKIVKEEFPAVVTQIPAMRIKDGKLSTEENKPYRIEDPKTKELIGIIDTTQVDPPRDMGGAKIFAAQTGVIMEKSTREKRSFDFSDIKDFTVTQEKINHWLNIFQTFGAAAAFPFIWFGLFIYRLIQALFFSIFTLIASKIFKVTLEYPAALRLTMIAITPPLMIDLIFKILNFKIPSPSLTFIVLVTAYIFFIVHCIRRGTPESLDSTPNTDS